MKMKKTKKSAIIAAGMAGILAVSGAFAFLTDYDSAKNKFQFLNDAGEQTIDITLVEPGWDEATDVDENGDYIVTEGDIDGDGVPNFAEDLIYGAPVDKAPHVVNDGENEVYTFVKVLVPTKNVITSTSGGVWEAEASKALFKLQDKDKNDLVAAQGNEEWTLIKTETNASYNSNTQAVTPATYTAYVFAHKTKVAPGASTAPVFDQVEMINLVNDQIEKTDNLSIYVDAYAVQADGVEATELSDIWTICTNDVIGAQGLDAFDYFAEIA